MSDYGQSVTISSNDNHQETFQLVLPAEDNSDQGKVSLFTNLGTALIGQTEGNEVIIDSVANNTTFRITTVIQRHKNIGLDMVL